MVPVAINMDGAGTLGNQLVRAIRDAIGSGRLRPGASLPGTRSLATSLGLSRNVVLAAYEQLVTEGYLQARQGAATRVSLDLPERRLQAEPLDSPEAAHAPVPMPLSRNGRRMSQAAAAARTLARRPAQARYNFEYGVVAPDARSREQLRRLAARAVAPAAYDYGDVAGYRPLRRALAAHLADYRGLSVDWQRLLIVGGSQQALDLTTRLLLDPGDAVILEDPHYQGARRACEAVGARLIPVPVDVDGLDCSDLPAARLACVTPSHQFPAGSVMSAARRLALIEWSRRHRACILEDDYDSEFRYDARPLEPIAAMADGERVIYAGTFAKSLFPGLRLGYLVVPDALVDAFVGARWLTDRGSPTLTQHLLAAFIEAGDYARHLRRCARRYAEQRQALVGALHRHLGDRVAIGSGAAGIHVVVWFPGLQRNREQDLVAAAAAQDCGVYPIAPYYAEAHHQPCAGLILGYAALTPEQIEAGVQRLARALAAVAR